MDAPDLNAPQQDAVAHGDGPLLILAGAGSGKTRVITHRIVRLVEKGWVRPWRILAVTFTNKAAGELRERTARLLEAELSVEEAHEKARSIWLGTFHSTCARLLRIHAADAGMRPDFLIFDDDDQKRLLGRVMKDLEISDKLATPRSILSAIDRAKNAGIGPDKYRGEDFFSDLVAQVYPEYQRRLRAQNGVDFNDLLLDVLRLCEAGGEAAERLAQRFDHVLVDEFQDTNRVQYQLVRFLSQRTRNLVVVGDDDQSIYRWRGADLRNILDFEADHPGCKTIKLEQNYRSTQTILDAANAVIARNIDRKQKRLFTENGPGQPLLYFTATDERQEAKFVVQALKTLENTEERGVADFAIFYRTHAQSRALEEQLRAHEVPYTIVGGIRFYDRAEIKDLLGYLRVIANPADEVSLERIVNSPARGVGDTTLDKVRALSRSRGVGLWEAMRLATGRRIEKPVKKARKKTLQRARRAARPTPSTVRTKGTTAQQSLLTPEMESPPPSRKDAAPTDAASLDAAPTDASLVDASLVDASLVHASLVDASLVDASLVDASLVDASLVDASLVDASLEDDDLLDDALPIDDDEPAGVVDVLGASPRKKLGVFVELIDGLRAQAEGSHDLALLANLTLERSGYLERLSVEDTPEAHDRVDNLAQLVASLREYQHDPSGIEEPSLVGYLERVSLVASADKATRGVSMMTVHAAKGLEFPVVFVTGLEEGTFPRVERGAPREELEEERRLAYVALTRARERLILTNAAHRQRYGDLPPSVGTALLDPLDMLSLRESRFLADIPAELITRPVTQKRAPRPPATGPRLRRGHSIEERDDGSVIEREPDPESRSSEPRERARSAVALIGGSAGRDRSDGSGHDESAGPRIDYDASEEASGAFRTGMVVRHSKYGEGKVLALSGSGTLLKVTVHFAAARTTKTVVASYLEPT